MLIRDARSTDARDIAEIHVRAWQHAYRGLVADALLDGLCVADRAEVWQQQLSDEIHRTLVAVEDGKLIGWLTFGACRDEDAAADTGEVYAVYLDPAYWRRGVGRALWCRASGELAEQGYGRLTVWVLEANGRARRFYEALGGVPDVDGTRVIERAGKPLTEVRYTCPVSAPEGAD